MPSISYLVPPVMNSSTIRNFFYSWKTRKRGPNKRLLSRPWTSSGNPNSVWILVTRKPDHVLIPCCFLHHSATPEQFILAHLDQPSSRLRTCTVRIRSKSLRKRLQSDLEFAYHDLKRDFKGFSKHFRTVSDFFQLVDTGPRNNRNIRDWTKYHKKPQRK